jgi:cyclohexyl-isocyanide hydratase
MLIDPKTAQAIQLRLEYNPAPPFNAGSPDTAPADVLALINERIAPSRSRRSQAIERAAARLTETASWDKHVKLRGLHGRSATKAGQPSLRRH